MSFFRRLLRVSSQDYRLRALVSSRVLEPLSSFDRAVHVFCDLDKTYLETEFESWIKMAKIPFESPHDKITVPAASEVLELVRWSSARDTKSHPSSALHFVSSSPPQLRLALDGKLTMDHLEWSTDTFKNQTYNLRMGRLDLLRHHIAFKTKAILDIASKLSQGSRVVMIGDNAEYDPFIYTGVRLLLEKYINWKGMREWLAGAQVEPTVLDQVIPSGIQIPDDIKFEGIYIRSVPTYSLGINSRFEGTWYQFDHWAQVAWSLMSKGIISTNMLPDFVRSLHNHHGVPLAHLRWCVEKSLNRDDVPDDVRTSANEILLELANRGSSGPTRRMLGWELDLFCDKDLHDLKISHSRDDANSWYKAIAAARTERKKAKNKN